MQGLTKRNFHEKGKTKYKTKLNVNVKKDRKPFYVV